MTKNKHAAAPATGVTTAPAATEGTGATGAPEAAVEGADQPGVATEGADGAGSKVDPAADTAQAAADAAIKESPVADPAPVVKPTQSVSKADKGSYIVASPIKHDGEDYEPGDTIRLPEATAHRLAGYLEA